MSMDLNQRRAEIYGEPTLQGSLYDERQKSVRTRLGIEALIIYAGASLVNCFVLEYCCKWVESETAAMSVIGVFCLIWFLIRCAVKGCIVGVSGNKAYRNGAIFTTFYAAINSFRFAFDVIESGCVIKDGTLSKDFLFMLAHIMLVVAGIFVLCVLYFGKKRETDRGESEGEK